MTAFLIGRPVLVSMLLVGACLLGVVSYTRLPVELIPFAELPMLVVHVASVREGDPHYLEQQVARIRDLFPKKGPLAILVGCTSLCIGVLAALAVGGHLLNGGTVFYWAAVLATASGIAFWVIRIHIDPTPATRIRDAVLALTCALLTLLTAWWTTTV